LLPTSQEEVSPALSAAVAVLCSSVAEVRAAYICRVRREQMDGSCFEERLEVALQPTTALGEHERVPDQVTSKLLAALPDPLQYNGLAWLSQIGVPAWRQYGVCVFNRADASG
jgi:hypothetical protein